jgi:hypothetical protein
MTPDELRRALLQRASVIAESVFRGNGSISNDQIESLERLSKLSEIMKQAAPPARKVKWPIGVFFLTLTLVTVLWFGRMPETEIELEAECSDVSFSLPKSQVLSTALLLTWIGASGLKALQLPRSRHREQITLEADAGEEAAVELRGAPGGKGDNSLNLSELVPRAGARIFIGESERPGNYHLTFRPAQLEPKIDVSGSIEVRYPPKPVSELVLTSPQSIILIPARDQIDLDLGLPAASQGSFSPNLSIEDLDLARIDRFLVPENTIVRSVSTVLGGGLYRESLHEERRVLRPGENLRFQHSSGTLRTLRLKDSRIAFTFHGRVQGMTVGSEDSQVSLMPTLLECLRARHGLSLLWGATLYGFGLVLGALKWLGIEP